MKLNVKLPSMSLLRGEIPDDGSGENRGAKLLRSVRKFVGWGILAVLFFGVFAWMSIPTRAIAWRVSHEARKAGFNVDFENIQVLPWGTLILRNVVWTFAPTRPQAQPAQYFLEEVSISIGLWSMLVGSMDVEIETEREEGRVWANYRRSTSESKLALKIEELPLYDVPKAAPSLGVPLFGIVAMDAELLLPEHRLSKAAGKIELSCSGCAAGDGESKLYIPGGKSLANEGMTLPRIDLGTLTGTFLVEDGKARLEPALETESEDLKVEVTGRLALRDMFARSQFNMILKVQLTDAFQERSEAVRFMYQGASDKSRLDPPEQGLGFRLEGTIGRPRFLGIKSISRSSRPDRSAKANRRLGGAFQSATTPRPTSIPSRPSRPEGAPGVGAANIPPGQGIERPSIEELNRIDSAPSPEDESDAPNEGPPPTEVQEAEPPPEDAPPPEDPVEDPAPEADAGEPEVEVVPAEEPLAEVPEEGTVEDGVPDGNEGDPPIEILDDGGEAPPE